MLKKFLIFISLLNLATISGLFFLDRTDLIFWLKTALLTLIIIQTILIFFVKNSPVKAKNTNCPPQYELLNSLSDCIAVIDENGLIKFFNQEAQSTTGFQQNDALDISYQSIIKFAQADGNSIEPAQDPILIARQSNQKFFTDLIYLKTFSNKILPISVIVAPSQTDSKDLVITFKNISQKLDKEREQLEFISTASHEMRTPIATISGYLGLVLNPKIAQIDDKAREYTVKAQDAVDHLGNLFKNLLNISKAEDRQMIITPEVVDIVSLTRQVCEDFSQQAQAKNLAIVFAPDTSRSKNLSPSILSYTDRSLLREVISNLTENAIKYTERGTVTLNATIKDSDSVLISVSDTGIGIPPEDIPHLFQKFYRVDNSQTRVIGGTGLGLHLCRKIIEQLHGKIWAESVFEKGSTFFIELERLDQATANKIASHQTVVANPSSQNHYPAPKISESETQ